MYCFVFTEVRILWCTFSLFLFYESNLQWKVRNMDIWPSESDMSEYAHTLPSNRAHAPHPCLLVERGEPASVHYLLEPPNYETYVDWMHRRRERWTGAIVPKFSDIFFVTFNFQNSNMNCWRGQNICQWVVKRLRNGWYAISVHW